MREWGVWPIRGGVGKPAPLFGRKRGSKRRKDIALSGKKGNRSCVSMTARKGKGREKLTT